MGIIAQLLLISARPPSLPEAKSLACVRLCYDGYSGCGCDGICYLLHVTGNLYDGVTGNLYDGVDFGLLLGQVQAKLVCW